MNDAELQMLGVQRDQAMAILGKVIEEVYGERCSENEAGCMCCVAWAIHDAMGNLTDSSLLEPRQ